MSAKKWTWEKIRNTPMSDKKRFKVILNMMPADIKKITDKIDNEEDLTEAEEERLEQWEQSPDSGSAGSIMGGLKSG